jgi:hypothetical protein
VRLHTREISMSTMSKVLGASALLLLLACNRSSPRTQGQPAVARAAVSQPTPAMPTRLLSLPVSAYHPALALDGDVAYLLTRDAAYRLAVGKTPQRFELDIGHGAVLAESGIVFWSQGAIWNAAKQGGSVWRVASVPKQPEYLVTSSGGIAWLDRADDGNYRIQSLAGKKPRLLLARQDEISAVTMIHDWVFFVQKAKDQSWRIGRVHVAGGEPAYTDSRTGPTPSQLTGTENLAYYDMDKSEIRQLTPDLKSEHVWLKNFVCSPIYEATNIFCVRVEGLYEIPADSRVAKQLLFGPRQTITLVRANAKWVVWVADVGADQLAVDMLPLE